MSCLQADVQAFKRREKPRGKAAHAELSQLQGTEVPSFLNGRTLRDYQIDSLHWMISNLRKKRNCILGDEMVSQSLALTHAILQTCTTIQAPVCNSSFLIMKRHPWG